MHQIAHVYANLVDALVILGGSYATAEPQGTPWQTRRRCHNFLTVQQLSIANTLIVSDSVQHSEYHS